MDKKRRRFSRDLWPKGFSLGVYRVWAFGAISAGCVVWIIDQLFPPALGKFKDTSVVLRGQQGHILGVSLTTDEKWRIRTRTRDVGQRYKNFLIAYEDKNFYTHWGVDFGALVRAVYGWVIQGRRSGASTLTMQVVRLLEPRPRTLWSKAIECLRAWQLECHFSKEEILGMYLTLVPMGHNIEGVRAASFGYFHKSPKELSPAEEALLVAIPQAPRLWTKMGAQERMKHLRQRVLRRLEQQGILTAVQNRVWSRGELRLFDGKMGGHAQHLLQTLRKTKPSEIEHRTYLREDLEKRAELLVKNHVRSLGYGPHVTGALLIMDAQSGAVQAYIGGAFWAHGAGGYVDILQSQRSPGSTLKPFIYAMGMDLGLIHPQTIVQDKRTNFHGYMPRNFGERFHGNVTVDEALRLSLNVPAVSVLEAIGAVAFTERLPIKMSAVGKRHKELATLPIALGGVGVRPYDVAALYSVFPRGDGTMVYPRVTHDEKKNVRAFLKARSVWYVNAILSQTSCSDLCVGQEGLFPSLCLPHKTGTSYGYRDAWTVGYTTTHVIVAWIGRSDGRSIPGLTGHTAAAPLVHKAVALLEKEERSWQLPCAPDGALIAKNAELPEGLRYFGSPSQRAGTGEGAGAETGWKGTSGPSIFFPSEGMRCCAKKGGVLVFSARSANPPLTWFLNGVAYQGDPHDRELRWTVTHYGLLRVTVMDSKGCSDSVQVTLVPPL